MNTDSIKFEINNTNTAVKTIRDNNYSLNKSLLTDSEYSISLANTHAQFIDTTFYNIKIIKDTHTHAFSLNQIKDPNISEALISGLIRDDYGFSSLVFYGEIVGNPNTIMDTITISPNLTSQSFMYSLDAIKGLAKPGQTIKCYLIVTDNDVTNGYKSTSSEQVYL